jgi:hypothetical protein
MSKMQKLDSMALLSEIPGIFFSVDGNARHQRLTMKKLGRRTHKIWPARSGALLPDATEDQLQTLDLVYTSRRPGPRLSHSPVAWPPTRALAQPETWETLPNYYSEERGGRGK